MTSMVVWAFLGGLLQGIYMALKMSGFWSWLLG